MNMIQCYMIRIMAGLLFVSARLAYPDVLPLDFDDSPATDNAYGQQTKSGFFELETLDFHERGRHSRQDGVSSKKSMALSPKGLDRYVDMKRRAMAAEHMKRADEYIQNEEWSNASQEIDMALIRCPEDVELMGKAAMIYAMVGNYEEASTLFRVYLQHYPDQVNHLAAWGGVLLRTDQLPTAYEMIARSLKLDPDNIAARYQMEIYNLLAGQSNAWEGWNQLSVQELNNVITWLIGEKEELVELIGPTGYTDLIRRMVGEQTCDSLDVIKPMVRELTLAQQEQDFEESMTLCAKLIQQGVENLWIRIILAQSCFETGRAKKAEEIIALMQRLYPEFPPVWYNGGFMALRLEKYDEAERMYKEALAREDSGVSLFALACAYAGQGKIDESWTILKQLKHTDPVMLQNWLEGDQPYLNNIKNHPRFYEVGIKGH